MSKFPLGTTGQEICFDITNTISAIEDSSKYHPLFGYGINEPTIAGTFAPGGLLQLGLPQLETFEIVQAPAFLKRTLTTPKLQEHARKYFEEVINNPLSIQLTKMDNVRSLARFDNPMQDRADIVLEDEIPDLVEVEQRQLTYHLQDRVSNVSPYSTQNSLTFNKLHLLSDWHPPKSKSWRY